MMIDIKATYEIPETDGRHWTEIYNSLLKALYIPEVDGPRVMASSGGPIGNVGAWVIIENMFDEDALYLSLRVTEDKVEVQAMNCTEEKALAAEEICRGLVKVS